MQFFLKTTVTTSLLALSSHAAYAGSIDALKLLNDYNLITSGDTTSYSEVDGNALIGGNLYGGGNYHIHNTPTGVPSLTVGGNIGADAKVNVNGQGLNVGGSVAGSVTMNGGGNAYVGSVAGSGDLKNNANGNGSSYVVGDIAGNVFTNSGNTIYGGNLTGTAGANGSGTVQHLPVATPFDPATRASEAITALKDFSAQLSAMTQNSQYSFSGNKVTFDAIADANGLAIFSINDANNFFKQAGEFQFNLANDVQTLLFNVINNDIDALLNINVNFLGGSAPNLGSKILWNFQNAKLIDINAQFGGSLLALNADVTTRQNIEGTLAAKTLIQGAEIHYQGLNADANDFPTPQSNPVTSTVPVPGTLPLLAIGFAGFNAFNRRRRAAA